MPLPLADGLGLSARQGAYRTAVATGADPVTTWSALPAEERAAAAAWLMDPAPDPAYPSLDRLHLSFAVMQSPTFLALRDAAHQHHLHLIVLRQLALAGHGGERGVAERPTPLEMRQMLDALGGTFLPAAEARACACLLAVTFADQPAGPGGVGSADGLPGGPRAAWHGELLQWYEQAGVPIPTAWVPHLLSHPDRQVRVRALRHLGRPTPPGSGPPGEPPPP